MISIPAEIRRWVTLGVIVAALCLVFAVLTMCHQRDTSRDRERTQVATGKALDTVAAKTDTIRNDQQEKQADVDKIQGSDQRLPDGYGAELESIRMRRGG